MNRIAALALVTFVPFAAAACSSYHVETDFDESVDFTSRKSWDWMDRAAGEPDPFAGNTIVAKRVRAAIERELAAKGLVYAGGGRSFLVALHTATRDRFDATSWPAWGPGWGGGWGSCWGGGWGWGYQHVTVSQWTEGTLVLDLVDPATSEVAWRGTVTSILDGDSGSEVEVDESIHKLFAEFPPKR